jgi:hypothetical protein
MTSEIILVLVILAGAIVLFVSEKLRVDQVAKLMLIPMAFQSLFGWKNDPLLNDAEYPGNQHYGDLWWNGA